MDLAVKKGRQITIFRLGQERKKKEKIDENKSWLNETQVRFIEKGKNNLKEMNLMGVRLFEFDAEKYHKQKKSVFLIPSALPEASIKQDKNWNWKEFLEHKTEEREHIYIFLSNEAIAIKR